MASEQKYPLMPKATAVWLVDNTKLTFKQIADFCGIHELEVKGIADGEVANNITAIDPVIAQQLDKEEIDRCSQDQSAKLKLKISAAYANATKKKPKVTSYTPIARRQDKPDAISWLLKNVPGIKDSQIIKLIGTTRATIESIRERTHWNISNIRQRDPVLLGICTQTELDRLIEKVKLSSDNSDENNLDQAN